jgi:hypothetical protein
MEINPSQQPPLKKQSTYAKDVIGMTRGLLNETYSSSVQSINTGFALAAALAWNEAVKTVIHKYFSNASVARNQFIYAITVTILSAVVFMLTKRFLNPSIDKSDIQPVIGYTR